MINILNHLFKILLSLYLIGSFLNLFMFFLRVLIGEIDFYSEYKKLPERIWYKRLAYTIVIVITLIMHSWYGMYLDSKETNIYG